MLYPVSTSGECAAVQAGSKSIAYYVSYINSLFTMDKILDKDV